MIKKEEIHSITEQILQETQFIVEIKVNENKNEIFIFVDDINGLTIAECKRISRFVESKLNEKDEIFSLEVSSPGLSNPFKVRQQYVKNIGKEIEVLLTDGEKLLGKLLSVNVEDIIIETTELKKIANKKQEVKEEHKIEFNNIKTSKNIISFK
ncbi:ribosome assembly cofactor RimP [Bacteroidales bacterium OttesenSCG-928-I21]|nr:ribosome assembly cofactor RimP [Bacteroidales bacterium OttesenSCG-928-I21]